MGDIRSCLFRRQPAAGGCSTQDLPLGRHPDTARRARHSPLRHRHRRAPAERQCVGQRPRGRREDRHRRPAPATAAVPRHRLHRPEELLRADRGLRRARAGDGPLQRVRHRRPPDAPLAHALLLARLPHEAGGESRPLPPPDAGGGDFKQSTVRATEHRFAARIERGSALQKYLFWPEKYFSVFQQSLLYLYPHNKTEKQNKILILKRLSNYGKI